VLKLEVRHITAQGTQYAARQEVQQANAAPKITLSALKVNTAALRDIPKYAATTVAIPIAIVVTTKTAAKVRINVVGQISAARNRVHAAQAQMSRFVAIMKHWHVVVASMDVWPHANVLLMQLGVI
jgi:hypothetical protein